MRSKNKAIRDYHAKMYVDAVFGDTLKQEGFINPDDKSISWYRVVNNELVHAVYFHASNGRVPILEMVIESRVYPLFCKPKYYSGIYSSGSNRHFGYRVISIRDLPDEHGTTYYGLYSDDIWVYTNKHGKRGLYTLETDILPWFQKSMTQADYYQVVTNEFLALKGDNFFRKTVLSDTAALAMYYGDNNIISECSAYLDEFLPEYLQNEFIEDKYKMQRMAEKSALDGTTRDEFLANLEIQKQKNIKWLKKMGIPV